MGMTREEFTARQHEKHNAAAAYRAERELIDYEVIAGIEDEKGIEVNTSLTVRNVVADAPVVLGVRAPTPAEYKRLVQTLHRPGITAEQKVAAAEQLARSCWVYPADPAVREQICAANSATMTQIGSLAQQLAELRAADEGKG